MEPLLDLERLHKGYRRNAVLRNLSIGIVVLSVVGFGSRALISRSRNHVAPQLIDVTSDASLERLQMATASSSSDTSSTQEVDALKKQAEEQKALADQYNAMAQQHSYVYVPDTSSTAPTKKTLTAPTSYPSTMTSGSGKLTGIYYYAVSYATLADGETSLGPVSFSVSPKNQQVMVSNIPINPNNDGTERRLYRTLAGGSMLGPFYLVTTIWNNSSGLYYDNMPDNSLPTYSPKY